MKAFHLYSTSILLGALTGGCGGEPSASVEELGVTREELAPDKFSGWLSVPGTSGGPPGGAFISRPGFVRDVFFLNDSRYVLWKRFAPGSGWSPATVLDAIPVATNSRPGATMWRSQSGEIEVDNHAAVAIRRTNNYIWVKVQNPAATGQGGWTLWDQIPNGGPFVDSPAIAYHRQGTGPRYLYVIARKSDQRYYWSRNNVGGGYAPANWSAWSVIPNGQFLTAPGAVSSAAGLWVVGTGLNNKLWEATYSGSWSAWSEIPGSGFAVSRQPSVAAWPNGRRHVFGFDGITITQATWFNGWSSFFPLYGGVSVGEFTMGWPAASSSGDWMLEVLGTYDSGYGEYLNIYDNDS
jgi:hypothetical protein